MRVLRAPKTGPSLGSFLRNPLCVLTVKFDFFYVYLFVLGVEGGKDGEREGRREERGKEGRERVSPEDNCKGQFLDSTM